MKKVQVVWTEESLSDLEVIYDFVAEQSLKSAKKIIRKILSRTRQLETFPHSGSPQKTNIEVIKEYRYLLEGNYKIIYSLKDNELYVEAIIDTRQGEITYKMSIP